MDMKIILFGSGEIGTEAFSFFGKDIVSCFCDNDLDIAGVQKCGKSIISFAELKQKHRDALVIISANRVNSDAMVRQCEENGISDYLVYEVIKSGVNNREELLDFIREPSNRLKLKLELYQKKVNELRQEVSYFKHHADIRKMKPATGGIRKRQLRTAHASAELFQKLSFLEIKPYLTGGNLLGYMRHGGFIPWDDDIDFDLIRDEFERLKAYCLSHMYSKQEFEEMQRMKNKHSEKKQIEDKKSFKIVEKEMENYYWVDWMHHFQVNIAFPDGDSIGVDFFPHDYYSESCQFEDFMELVYKMKQEWELVAASEEEQLSCIEAAKRGNQKNTVKNSNRIYFGVDNLANFRSYHKGGWIPKDVVFPLKQITYEGELFWVPNQVEEYISYLFKNVWDFPGDNIAIPKHYLRHKLMEE